MLPFHAPLVHFSGFTLGRGVFALIRDPDLVPLAVEVLNLAGLRARMPGVCPQCVGSIDCSDLLYWRCKRCSWTRRNPSLDVLWGLAYAGLTSAGASGVPAVHAPPRDTRHAVFSRLYQPLFDVLGRETYATLQRAFWCQYPLAFAPRDRLVRLPDCTCGHPATEHGGNAYQSDFFASPRCISGCACPYYCPATK
jgi:hypothetical protein